MNVTVPFKDLVPSCAAAELPKASASAAMRQELLWQAATLTVLQQPTAQTAEQQI